MSADAAVSVMAAYNDTFSAFWKKPLVLTPKRRKHLRARLKRFSVEDIVQAMKNLRADTWMCGKGKDNTTFYATPEYLFRSDENVEKWLSGKGGNSRGPTGRGPTDDDEEFYRDIMR